MPLNGGDLGAAIEIAVQKCIKEGQISDFLKDHSREVTGMLFKEISMEEYGEIRAREAYDIGHSEGEQAGISETARKMKEKGIPEETIKEITGLSPQEYEK